MTTPTPTRPEPDIKWTPRQKQVLDLLVKRYTNGQIGEALGISLDGAKWHVSEIIGILGVDSREEAAEYWREYNGLPARFRRVAAGLFTGTAALRWAAAVGGIGLLVVAGMVYAALQSVGGEEAASTPVATVTVDTSSPPVTPSPGSGGSTPGTTGETVAGVPVRTLGTGNAAELPEGVTAYYSVWPYASDALPGNLTRVYRDSQGQLRSDRLFTDLSQHGDVYSWTADIDRGQFVAAVCVQGYCGGVANASADAATRVFRSDDGGVTWEEFGAGVPPNTFLIGPADGGGVVASTFFPGPPARQRIWQYPSGTDVGSPAGAKSPVPIYQQGLGYLWRAEKGTYIDATGKAVAGGFQPPVADPDSASYTVMPLLSSSTLMTWKWPPNDPRLYWGAIDANGILQRAWSHELDVAASVVLSDRFVLGSVRRPAVRSDVDSDVEVALIDLESGVVSPLTDLSADMLGGNQHPFLRGATTGRVLRVTGAGDCLNVRERPEMSAPVLACYRDGVLLRDRDESREAGGVTWLAVATPDGREGWASGEFLEK